MQEFKVHFNLIRQVLLHKRFNILIPISIIKCLQINHLQIKMLLIAIKDLILMYKAINHQKNLVKLLKDRKELMSI
jgi:hypothetical protein